MPKHLSQTDSAEQYASETATIIHSCRKALVEFQTRAKVELRILWALKRDTRVVIAETQNLLLPPGLAHSVAQTELPNHEPHANTRETPVFLYSALLFRQSGKVFRVENFIAGSDDAALAHVQRQFGSEMGPGYEIWDGKRHVHTQRDV